LRAAWYEHQGDPYHSLVVGEMPDPAPGAGEVRIVITVSGLSPGDVKKRSGWQGSAMSYRPFGTAAEYVVVPSDLAVPLTASADTPQPSDDLDAQASCLGIAGITAHRAVFADGPVDGLTVLIHGATGGVGSIATQLARRDGAHVLAVVLNDHQIGQALQLGAHHAFRNDDPDLAGRIAAAAPNGVHRIAEVDFAGHVHLDAAILATGGVVCSYSTSDDHPAIPYWALGFKDTTLRLLGSDDFPATVKAGAARTLTEALLDGSLRSHIAARYPLDQIADAHAAVEAGAGGRVVIEVT
jgi:NADPH2:quinone reductase